MSTDLWELVTGASLGTLATIKRDGRPQLSDVTYVADPDRRIIRISSKDGLAKVHNLRRDPRAGLHVQAPGGQGYAVVEATASVSPVSAGEQDATVAELVEIYRLAAGEHPDWAEYRQVMVADRRLVIRLDVERVYGWRMG